MNSNNQIQIRQGLVNYLGALMSSSPYENFDAKQDLIAILTEESLNLASENDRYDLYSLKPILRAAVIILEQRKNDLITVNKELSLSKSNDSAIDKYNNVITHIKLLVESIERSDLVE